MTDYYESWLENHRRCKPIPLDRIREIFQWTTQFGPANCWTGTTGTAAAMIRELLIERAMYEQIIKDIESEKEVQDDGR